MQASAQPAFLDGVHDRGKTGEPWGAEDWGAEDAEVSIPEPMVFDLVRPLGAHRGESEVNVLAMFPFGGDDSRGHQPVDWAPEIEYAVRDGFAVEFELPFEDGELEAYKFALQWTFGAWRECVIHGAQVIVEPEKHFDECGATVLYLLGARLSQRWSTLAMLGVETQFGEAHTDQAIGILNVSLFRDLSPWSTVGVECDSRLGASESSAVEIIPQLHCELTDHSELQVGVGAGFDYDGAYGLVGMRAIVSW